MQLEDKLEKVTSANKYERSGTYIKDNHIKVQHTVYRKFTPSSSTKEVSETEGFVCILFVRKNSQKIWLPKWITLNWMRSTTTLNVKSRIIQRTAIIPKDTKQT